MVNEYSEIGNKSLHRRFKMVNIVKIIGGVIVLLLIVEALGILVGNLTLKPVVAQWGTIEKGWWAEALFLRDETMLSAPTSGDLNIKLVDGIRVAHGEIVATINTTDSGNQNDNSKLQLGLQTVKREVQTLQADLDRVGLEITTKNAKLSHISKNSAQVRYLQEDLISLQQEKARILRNIENNRLAIQSTGKKINNGPVGTAIITVDQPGFLFYQFDEWEEHFSPEQFSGLVPADFNRIYALKSPEKQVKTGMNIAKVINPFRQIIAVIIDPNQTGVPVTGDIWQFKNGENRFQCTVVNQTKVADHKMIIALEDVSMLPEFMPNRRAKIFLIYKSISGIVIPVQALFKKGQQMTVKVVKGDGYKETKVTVLENDGVKAIIKGIEFGTTIISR